MASDSVRRFVGFVSLATLLALGSLVGLALGWTLGGGAGWGVLVLPLAFVAGLMAWGAIAFAASLVTAMRERSLGAVLQPRQDPPGAFCVPLACVLSGPALGLASDAGWTGVLSGLALATCYGGVAYAVVRRIEHMGPAGDGE